MKRYFTKYDLYFPIGIYTIWRAILYIVQISIQSLPSDTNLLQKLAIPWTQYWDSEHYVTIAKQGYHYPEQAFFPLWPLIIRYTDTIFNNIPFTVILTSTFFSMTAFIAFYILAQLKLDQKRARKALLLFTAFPASLFLIAGYSESLFVTLVLTSFIYIEKEKYWTASIIGGFASATRVIGIAIAACLLVVHDKLTKKISYFLIAIAGLVFFIVYLFITTGNPLYFQYAQQHWCNQHLINPKAVEFKCQITVPLITLWDFNYIRKTPYIQIDAIMSNILLIVLIPIYKKFGKKYFLYSCISLLVPTTFGRLVSMTRFILPVFPAFFIAAHLLERKIFFIATMTLLICIQLIFLTLFLNKGFIG
jgi:Gpi18-like mannosyltransferase